MKRGILGFVEIVSLLCPIFADVSNGNQPPVVKAGSDSIIAVGYTFRFNGSVTDDGLPAGSELEYQWKQISGPESGVTVLAPASSKSLTTITDTGVFVFELSATDGELTAADTITIMVKAALPFKVLSPKTGESIRAGSAVTITWQMDPVSNVNINMSINGGLTYKYLAGPVVVISNTGSWQWHVPDTIEPSDECIIQVQYYGDHGRNAVSGPFTISEAISAINGRKFANVQPKGYSTMKRFCINGRMILTVEKPLFQSGTGYWSAHNIVLAK